MNKRKIIIIYSPIQGEGGGVDVDVLGAIEGFYNSKKFKHIYLVANKTTLKRFPEIKKMTTIIKTPYLLDNKIVRKLLKGRIFTFLGIVLIPITTTFKLIFHINKKRDLISLLVFYNATGGALLAYLIALTGFDIKKKCLSLTGMPSFLLNNKVKWRDLESKLIKKIWSIFSLSSYDSIFCLSLSTKNILKKLFAHKNEFNFIHVPNPSFHSKRELILKDLHDKYKKQILNKSYTPTKFKKTLNLLLVGRFSKQKNQSLAIRAVKNFNNPNYKIKITLFGNGDEESNLKQLVKQLNLEKIVIFKNFSNNILKNIIKYDAILCTSLWEDSSVFLNESLSIGIPVIAQLNLHGIESYTLNQKLKPLFFRSYDEASVKKSIEYLQNNTEEISKVFLEEAPLKLFLHTSKSYSDLTTKYLA